MATVKLFTSANMFDLPGAGVTTFETDDESFAIYSSVTASYVQGIGPLGTAGRLVQTAIFDTTDAADAPDFQITGLNRLVDSDYGQNVVLAGNFFQFLEDLLSGNDTVIGSPGGG